MALFRLKNHVLLCIIMIQMRVLHVLLIFSVVSEWLFFCFLSTPDDGRLSSPAERAEAAQTDSQALSSSWSSPQHPPRAQSLRSPVTYKKQLTSELQRRSSSTLGNFISLCYRGVLYQPVGVALEWGERKQSEGSLCSYSKYFSENEYVFLDLVESMLRNREFH